MNTKVKVGIAAVIVAALVALIVLDQKTAPPSEASKGSAPADETTLLAPPVTPDAAAQRLRDEEVRSLIDQSRRQFGGAGSPSSPAAPAPAPAGPKKGDEPPPGKEIRPLAQDEYVIQEGDTFESIAERKYGSRAYAALLIKANPTVKPTALRVGRKISVPPKPEDSARAEAPAPVRADEPPAAAARVAEPLPAAPAPAGPRTYVVQPGDTLSGISLKVYNTSRHWEKLYEANRDKISDPSVMVVGTKLTVPDLPVKAGPATGGGAVPTAAAPAPAGGRIHQVQPNDSLWKIAEKYAGNRGVLEMIEAILKANPDKLKDEKSLLRVGWSLVIPE